MEGFLEVRKEQNPVCLLYKGPGGLFLLESVKYINFPWTFRNSNAVDQTLPCCCISRNRTHGSLSPYHFWIPNLNNKIKQWMRSMEHFVSTIKDLQRTFYCDLELYQPLVLATLTVKSRGQHLARIFPVTKPKWANRQEKYLRIINKWNRHGRGRLGMSSLRKINQVSKRV